MTDASDELALYLHLARASEVRRRPLVRDKLLVLAGKQAVDLRLTPVAEHCRSKILAHNPGHILRNYSSLAEALQDERFRVFFKRLAQAYPRERAEHMLRSLGIQLAGERHVYADELEYAAALLGTTPERLGELGASIGTQNGRHGSPQQGLAQPAAIEAGESDSADLVLGGVPRCYSRRRLALLGAVAVTLLTLLAGVGLWWANR